MHGVLVHRHGLLQRAEVHMVRAGLIRHDARQGIRHILSRHGRAVMEQGVLTDLELPGHLILQQLVALCQVHHQLAVVVLLDKVTVHVVQHRRGVAVVQRLRVCCHDIGIRGKGKRGAVVAGRRRACAGGCRCAAACRAAAAAGQNSGQHQNSKAKRKAVAKFLVHTFPPSDTLHVQYISIRPGRVVPVTPDARTRASWWP